MHFLIFKDHKKSINLNFKQTIQAQKKLVQQQKLPIIKLKKKIKSNQPILSKTNILTF